MPIRISFHADGVSLSAIASSVEEAVCQAINIANEELGEVRKLVSDRDKAQPVFTH